MGGEAASVIAACANGTWNKSLIDADWPGRRAKWDGVGARWYQARKKSMRKPLPQRGESIDGGFMPRNAHGTRRVRTLGYAGVLFGAARSVQSCPVDPLATIRVVGVGGCL